MADRTIVKGSEKRAVTGSRMIGPIDADEHVEVTVVLRRKGDGHDAIMARAAAAHPAERRQMSREEYAERFGASTDDVIKLESFARAHNLHVDRVQEESRSVALSGSAADMSRAFGVELRQYEHPMGGRFRGRTGPIMLPSELADLVQSVVGLDDRPVAQPRLRRLEARATPSALSPLDVAQAYEFPKATGKGQTIAIIELGGGFRLSELKTYFQTDLKLAHIPKVVAVTIDGGRKRPGIDPNADGEVMLDIEVAGAVAPEATIVVYFAPNTDRGFLDAINAAVHDRHHRPSVISISWGSPESKWTDQSLEAFSQAFEAATAVGVTVCAAAGDAGSTDGLDDGMQHTDYPASDPNVLGCGGTRLILDGKASVETVWNNGPGNATGGGISDHFDRPAWQASITVSSANPGGRAGRGVPDVAGNADPVTGYKVLVDGQREAIGGTSAVAPLWAGLVALLNAPLGGRSLGLLQPLLYANPTALRDITQGDNGAYKALSSAWDACTGLGTPNCPVLLKITQPPPDPKAA
jgi:kumamolisin